MDTKEAQEKINEMFQESPVLKAIKEEITGASQGLRPTNRHQRQHEQLLKRIRESELIDEITLPKEKEPIKELSETGISKHVKTFTRLKAIVPNGGLMFLICSFRSRLKRLIILPPAPIILGTGSLE